MAFSPNAQMIYADGPSTAPLHPEKHEIRTLLTAYEAVMNAFTTNAGLIFKSMSAMNAAATEYDDPRSAWLFGSGAGVYVLNPATDTWTKVGRLPWDYVVGTDLGAGTPNALQITTDFSVTDGMIVAFSLFEATTGSPVTVSVNGGGPLTLKTPRGTNASALGAGQEIWFRVRSSDSTARMINDNDVSAMVAQAEAARDDAEAAEVAAEAARDVAAGYASDAVSQGNVPIYSTVEGMSAVEVPEGVNAIRVNGRASAGDSQGGLFVETDNGTPVAFTSGGSTARGWYKVYSKLARPLRFETAGDDTVLREIVAADGEYKAFPVMAKLPSGRLVVVYWRGNGHSPNIAGDGLGQMEAIHSDDGGATWSEPVAVYGNLDNGDPQFAYWLALGADRYGRAVFLLGINNGSDIVRPFITRSDDGERWSAPVEMTVTGSTDVTSAGLIPFGAIELLPSGRMVVPVYQGNFNWAGIIDDDVSETALDLSSLIVNSASPAYSESAICPLSEKVWLAFMRLDGAVGSIPTFRTVDGGQTWTSLGNTGLPTGGGYIIQAAFPFEIGGMTHIGILAGIRTTVSGPIPEAPGMLFAATSYKDLTESGDPQFRQRHVWAMVDDGHIRDAYAGYVFDPVTMSLGIVTHEETEEDESRILFGALNVGSALNGQPEQVRRAWTPTIVGSTVVGANTYGERSAWYSTTGDWVDGYFRIQVTTLASQGNLSVAGFPIAFENNQEIAVQTATGLSASIEDLSLRPDTGGTTATIFERGGLSNLAHTEISGTFEIRCTFRYRRDRVGA